ncbi:hypothetical protein [Metabacillus endolithicus]|uniref:SLH domain-containing protein n=1 Tax=Metabacillus endolithicus TaxID=1535204 RepID=A0ABW5C2A4_9BACI|nr:hypothetical protein [Metabacillus endolithicus]UPG65597.1 hypothetical protein MVE64_11850 [Metabacillus endolithicus]
MIASTKKLRSSLLKASTLLLVTSSILITPTISEAVNSKKPQLSNSEMTKYPAEIIKGIRLTLRIEKHGRLTPIEITEQIENMSKVNAMDTYIRSFPNDLTGSRVREIVHQIYKIDLDAISDLGAGTKQSVYPDQITKAIKQVVDVDDIDSYIHNLSKSEVMDLYLESYHYELAPSAIRVAINLIFGTNLDGISTLENSGIGLFSKGQWINQSSEDLFVVHTSDDDVDVKIYPTDYFKKRTGLDELPSDLQDSLKELGYYFNKEIGAYYYADPHGQSVPDSFKGQTLGLLIGYISTNYSDR